MEVPKSSPEREEEKKWAVTRRAFVEELKKSSFLAVPLAGVMVFQFLLQVVSSMMVGHLGKLSLVSVSIATLVTNITGFIPLQSSVNELGAGNPQQARLVTFLGIVLGVAEAAIVSVTLFCCRYVLAYAFNSDKDVVNYVSELVPLFSFTIFMDNMQSVLSGVARGIGWQHIVAYVNLGSFYIVGIPVVTVLCFIIHLRAKGLMLGLISGSTVQAVALAIITSLTNWQKQATMARERIFEGAPSCHRIKIKVLETIAVGIIDTTK